MYIFSRGGGAYIWLFGWLGKKDDDLLSKTQIQRGRGEKNGEKGEIFTVPWGKISFLKKGGGAKISYFGQIYTPERKLTDKKLNP